MAERFLRVVGLTMVNEVRLLGRDPVSLLMLVIAPVVIMTVAGYSLGALYGNRDRIAEIALVDHDGGDIAGALVDAVPSDAPFRLARVDDLAAVRERLGDPDAAPLAIEVPAGAEARLAAGRSAALVLYVDPARRLEVHALEVALGAVQRRAAAATRRRTQRALAVQARATRHAGVRLERRLAREERGLRRSIDEGARAAVAAMRAKVRLALDRSQRDAEAALRRSSALALGRVRAEVDLRGAALARVAARLHALTAVQPALERWLAAAREGAGRHAAAIPPPPELPVLPAEEDLAVLQRPLDLHDLTLTLPVLDSASLVGPIAADLVVAGRPATRDVLDELRVPLTTAPPVLPGVLDVVERPAVDGAAIRVNPFDQYVPGFGVTFLLIGMMLGLSLTLFDERDWGTLERVRAGGGSLAGILIGKVLARSLVGVAQMAVLFGVGRAVFGVSLGPAPMALVAPTLGMAFAGAALGLVVPALAPAHDSVMPLGTMTSLALAAVGGCWWPLDFEPAWMRAVARWLPTTWTMQAYNDLMIRGAPASAVLVPSLVTTAIGTAILVAGIALSLASSRRRA
jgi:ABC-type multidrug transport system permease subunit